MNIISVAIGAIIERDDSILLIKRKKKHFLDSWTLPVGKLKFGEKAVDAVKREVKEELGLDFSPNFCCYNDAINILPGKHYLMLYFFGRARGKLKLNKNELIDARWYPLKKALKMDLGFEHKEALEKYRRRNSE